MARPIPGRVSLLLLASLLPQSVATMTMKNCTERTLGCKTSCGVLKSLDSKLLSSAINSSSSALKLLEPCRFCKCRKCQTCIAAWHAGRTPWATAATSVTGKRIYLHPATYTRPVVRRAVKQSVGKDVREVEGKMLRNLIGKCLQKKPGRRPSISEILLHPYFITTGMGFF